MEKLFKLKENGTAVKTEVVAGVTTFLAMAYILAVNPSMLGAAGMDSSAVFAATAVSAAFATLFTGTNPCFHGITGDSIYDFEKDKELPCLYDPAFLGNYTHDNYSPKNLIL